MCPKARYLIGIFTMLVALFATGSSFAGNNFEFSFTLEEKYDSNSLRSPRGQELEDFITSFTPELSYTRTGHRLDVTALYYVSARVYSKNPQQNLVAHHASVDTSTRISGKTTLDIGDTLDYTPILSEIQEISDLNLQIKYTDVLYNNFYAGISHLLTETLSVRANLNETFLEFNDPSLTDSRTDSVSASLSYLVSPGWSVTSAYDYSKISFARGDQGNAELHSLSFALSANPTKSIFLDLAGGVVYSQDLNSDVTWTAKAAIRKELRMFTFSTAFSRALSNSTGLANEINISNVVTAAIDARLTETMNVRLNGTYSDNKSEPNALLNTKGYSAGISGTWRINKLLTFGYGYSRFEQLASENSTAFDILIDSVYLNLSSNFYEWNF